MTELQRKSIDHMDAVTRRVWKHLAKTLGKGLPLLSLQKVTLLHMIAVVSKFIEDASDPAIVFAYYADPPFWRNLFRNNGSSNQAERSVILAGDLPPPHITVEFLSPNIVDSPPAKECCLIILSPRISLLLCTHSQIGSYDDTTELFELFWSSTPSVITEVLDLCVTAEEFFPPADRATLGYAYQKFPPVLPDVERLATLTHAFLDFAGERDMMVVQERQASEERLRWHDDVTAMVVHDLRTPLQSISLLLETLNNQPPVNNAHYGTMIAMALQSTVTMDRLIQTLLDLSRLQSGAFTVQWQPINVRLLISEIVDPFMSLFEHSRLTLVLEFISSPIPPWGDPGLLLRVFHNLLDNAVRFTPPGGTITVSSDVSDDGACAIIRVHDTGRGISAEALPHIFDRHFQSQPYDRRGAGMGLYFCKLAIAAQHGSIYATSTPGAGTTITVVLQTHPIEAFLGGHMP